MRVIFLGSPEYAIPSLEALLKSKHQVIAVVTQPDKAQDRGQKIKPCAVRKFAEEKGLKVFEFQKISRDGIEILKGLEPDIMITVAYGQILSGEVISIPKFGVINAHASILPKYRGASPVASAVANGDTETGVTIMQTEIGLDTGDIILVKRTKIEDDETTGELSNRLSLMSAEALLSALELIEKGKTMPKRQNHADSSISKKLTKHDSIINWKKNARQIKQQILSQNPFPIACTILNSEVFKIYRAKLALGHDNTNEAAGTVIEPSSSKNGVFVQCGNGVLEIIQGSLPGGKILDAKSFFMSNKIKVGTKFEEFAISALKGE